MCAHTRRHAVAEEAHRAQVGVVLEVGPETMASSKARERLERRGVIIQPDTGKEDSKGVLNRLMSWLDS